MGFVIYVRRLLSAVLAIALTHLGVVARAPAHAHHGDTPHSLHAVELYASDAHASHHHASHSRGSHHHGLTDHGDEATGDDDAGDHQKGSDETDRGTIVHVHSSPQFTPADVEHSVLMLVAVRAPMRPTHAFGLSSWSGAPPFRPPRNVL